MIYSFTIMINFRFFGSYNMMMKQKITKKGIAIALSLFLFSIVAPRLYSQPVVDTVHAIQKQNERTYRMLDQLDATGDSYTFTNVVKWKIRFAMRLQKIPSV